jgi:formamidopyrimidine-DNA glycosylase
MPELPDLEVIAEVLGRVVAGRRIVAAEVLRPLVVRSLPDGQEPCALLTGREVRAVSRRGKFLLLELSGGPWLAVNPMLAGRLRRGPHPLRRLTRDYIALTLSDGTDLVYHDTEGLGKVYVTERLDLVPGYTDLGPEPLAPENTAEAFLARLKGFRGEIKGVLTRGALVAGIGNAYADEILFDAGVYPFRTVRSLSRAERLRVYESIRGVLARAVEELRPLIGEETDALHRGTMRVHMKKGEPCPRCGQAISEVAATGRITNFCRQCQPGTLFG